MKTSNFDLKPCKHCGNYHDQVCPRIKSIEYFQNGLVKKVEYHQENQEKYYNYDFSALPNSTSDQFFQQTKPLPIIKTTELDHGIETTNNNFRKI